MNAKVRLTVGQAVAKYLQNQWTERDGIEHRLIRKLCCIYGHGNLSGIGQGFFECASDTETCQPFHEQSMVHMAVGYARIKRRLSTMACTTSIGPGTANLYTGAAGATIQRVPVLLLPSDHYGTRRQGIVLQQLEDAKNYDLSVTDGLRTVSTFFDKITRPEQIISSLIEATRVLTSPSETGAVTISICQDVQGEAGEFPVELFEKRVWHIDRRVPQTDQVERVIKLIQSARKPLIISGGGVYYSEAEIELCEFAEEFEIPVVETIAGRSTMHGESKMSLGAVGIAGNSAANLAAEKADLIIAIGTRLTDVITCSQTLFQNPNVKFASINVSERDAKKMAAETILADAREGLIKLTESARAAGIKPIEKWVNYVHKLKNDWKEKVVPTLVPNPEKTMSQAQALKVINDTIPDNSYVIAAAGSLPGDINKLWDTQRQRRCHLEFGFSCMTYEIPAGIGLAVAGENNIYVCVGDGTYLMNPSDLIVAIREKLNITICLFVNHGYQIIRELQQQTTATEFDTEFRHYSNSCKTKGEYLAIDYLSHAKSFGAEVYAAQTSVGLKLSLEQANNNQGVTVIVIIVDPYIMSIGTENSFWDIAPPIVSKNPSVQKLRRIYESTRDKLQHHYL